VRRVTRPIRREMKRRAAVEPVISHLKTEHRMGCNYLKGRDGDRINAVLAAAGYNFSLLLRWLSKLLRALLHALLPPPICFRYPKNYRSIVLHGRRIYFSSAVNTPFQLAGGASIWNWAMRRR
jgi:hypothetical protein